MKIINEEKEEQPYKMESRYLIKLRIEKETNKIVKVSVEFCDPGELTIPRLDRKYLDKYYAIWIRSDRDFDISELQQIRDEFLDNKIKLTMIEDKWDISLLQYNYYSKVV